MQTIKKNSLYIEGPPHCLNSFYFYTLPKFIIIYILINIFISSNMHFLYFISALAFALPGFASPAGDCNPRVDPSCFFNPPANRFRGANSFSFDMNPVDLGRSPYIRNVGHVRVSVVVTDNGGVDFVITALSTMPARVDNVQYQATAGSLTRPSPNGNWDPQDVHNPITRVSFTATEIAQLRQAGNGGSVGFSFSATENSELRA